MSANKPTPRGHVNQAKTTYISWGDYDFELVGSNTYRPGLSAANESEVVSNVKVYKSYTPKDSLEPMQIHVMYDPETWSALRALKEAGTVQTLETSDGFSAPAMISEMGSVDADVQEPITDLPLTFVFPDQGTGTN